MKKAISIFIVSLCVFLAVAVLLVCLNFSKIIGMNYPRKYAPYIQKYAQEYQVDQDLLYAIVKTESGFNPEAISHAKARGLMQLTEETFVWVRTKLGEKETTFDDMFDPETNIRYGAYLIDYLMEEFGDVKTAAAAYHAGRGAVGKWLKDESCSKDGKTLYHIPISDTEHYVDKIADSYSIYQKYQ